MGTVIGVLAAASATVVLVAGGAAAANSATSKGEMTPALLTYVARDGGLCVVRADGTHAVRLTPRWKRVENPSWSPDGRYVAFDRSAGYDSYGEQPLAKVLVADARGRVRWEFGAGNTNAQPLWSPDGRHIAYFARWAHSDAIDVARPNGSGENEISTGGGWSTTGEPLHPAWTPDGGRLVFDDDTDPATRTGRSIFSVTVDGGDRRVLVANAEEPAYSPTGSKVAYVALDENARPIGIAVADADGNDPQLIFSSTSVAWFPAPAWSPKGTAVAFSVQTGPSGETAIVVARADGTGERVVASEGYFLGWSRDGKLIAYDRRAGIFVVHPDGSGRRLLVKRRSPRGAAWRPAVALPTAKRLRCPLR
jgi:Tol biopolymer transport system component